MVYCLVMRVSLAYYICNLCSFQNITVIIDSQFDLIAKMHSIHRHNTSQLPDDLLDFLRSRRNLIQERNYSCRGVPCLNLNRISNTLISQFLKQLKTLMHNFFMGDNNVNFFLQNIDGYFDQPTFYFFSQVIFYFGLTVCAIDFRKLKGIY